MAQGRGRGGVTNIYIVNNDPNVRFDASNYAELLNMGQGMFRGQNFTVTPQGVVVEDLRMREELRRQRAEEEARRMREEAEKKRRWDNAAKKFPCLEEKKQADWKRIIAKYNYKEEENFYELRIHDAVQTLFEQNYTVFLHGYAGDGKTATARYFAYVKSKTLEGFQDREVLHINSYEEWKQKVKGDKMQVIIIDDIFGKNLMNAAKVEMWQDVLYDMRMQVKIADGNLMLIVTSGTHIYDQVRSHLKGCELFPPTETIDLSHALLHTDSATKVKLAEKVHGSAIYINTKKDIEKNSGNLLLGSRIYASSRKDRSDYRPKHVFSDAFYFYELDAEFVCSLDKGLYAVLMYVVMKDHAKMNFGSLEEMPDQDRELLKALFRSQEVDFNDLEPWILNVMVQMLSGHFFLSVGDGTYRMISPAVRAALLNRFSYRHSDVLVEHLDRDALLEFLATPGTYLTYHHKIVTVAYNALDKLARRVVFEILQGEVKYICCHYCFREEKFTTACFEYMEKLGNTEAVLRTRDELDKSLMYWSAWYGRDPLLLRLVESDQWWELAHEEERNLAFVFALYRGCRKSVKVFFEKRNYSAEELPELDLEGIRELHGSQFLYELSAATAPIHLAAYSSCMHTLREILPRCKNYELPDRNGMTPVHIAAAVGGNDALIQILDKAIDVNVKTPIGTTPLQLAVSAGHTDAVQSLINKRADANLPTDDGHPLLHVAINGGVQPILRTLLDAGVDKNKSYVKTWKPLMQALHLGNLELAEVLIQKGCDKFIKFHPNDTPFHWALETDDDEMCDILMEQGLYFKDPGTNCWYPLHVAAKKGNTRVIENLLKIGASPCVKNTDGDTPKEVAKKYSKHAAANLLWNDNPDQQKKRPRRYGYGKYGMYGMDMMYY